MSRDSRSDTTSPRDGCSIGQTGTTSASVEPPETPRRNQDLVRRPVRSVGRQAPVLNSRQPAEVAGDSSSSSGGGGCNSSPGRDPSASMVAAAGQQTGSTVMMMQKHLIFNDQQVVGGTDHAWWAVGRTTTCYFIQPLHTSPKLCAKVRCN